MRVGDGAWCWFNEPRALTIDGLTVAGWVGRNGDIRVASYDKQAGTLETHVLHPRLQYDDHANPAFYLRQDGLLTAFYSKHAGTPLYYRTTTSPGQAASWGPEKTVPTNTPGPYGYTYPNPVWSPLESKLYLFWRGPDWSADYATRTAAGRWSRAHRLLHVPGQRPYVKLDSDGRGTVWDAGGAASP